MTEREAIETINSEYERFYMLSTTRDFDTAMAVSIKALEELALYKEGGLCLVPADTYEKQCEELDELKERQMAKEVLVINKGISRLQPYLKCPACSLFFGYVRDYRETKYKPCYCDRCGQKLDWSGGWENVRPAPLEMSEIEQEGKA